MSRPIQKLPLAEVVEVTSGQVDPTRSPYAEMPHVGGENIESGTGRIFGVRTAAELRLISGKYAFRAGEILYSKIRPALNKVTIPDFDGICSADIYPLRVNTGVAEPRYLIHVLRSQDFLAYTEQHSSRTNIPKVNRDALLGYEAALPTLPDQRRIANILDKADAIRRKRRQAATNTAALPLAVFTESFDPGDKSLRREPLSTVAEVVSGVTKGRRFDGATVKTVPYLRVANVQDGYLDLTEIKTIEALPTEIAALTLQSGDVVMTEGGDHDKLGRGAIWEHDLPNCIHQNHIFRVRLDRSRVLPQYFATYLRTPEAKSYFLRCAKKTTNLASINITQLKSLPVPLAPHRQQEQFVESLRVAQRLATHMRTHEAEADNLFDSLVQRAFRGEL